MNTALGWLGLQVREAYGTLIDADDRQYRLLTSGTGAAAYNDLIDAEQTGEREIARGRYFRNPVGGALPDMLVARVIGAGATYKAEDENVQAVIDRFKSDPYNDLDTFLPKFATELLVFGELVLPIFLTPENADVRLGYLTPDAIEQVIWETGNEKRPLAVLQRKPTALVNEPKRLWIIPYPDPQQDNHYPPHPAITDEQEENTVTGDDGLPVILPDDPQIRDLLEKGEVRVAGYAFYHRTHCLVSGRGRSIYERVNKWIEGFGDWFFGVTRNAVLQGAFVWHVTMQGANPADIQKRRQELTSVPKPGSVILTNEKEMWEALSPSLPDSGAIHEMYAGLLSVIGVAVGLPGHELGGEGDTNRSTAKESKSVSVNRAKRFSKELGSIVCAWLAYQVDQKVYRGQLAEGIDRTVECILAEMDEGDEEQKAAAAQQLAAALVPMVDSGLMTQAQARTVVANLWGMDVATDAEFEADKRERQQDALNDPSSPMNPILRQLSGQKLAANGNGNGAKPAQGSANAGRG